MSPKDDRIRFLFVLNHPGYARNYEDVLRLLLERGHRIHLIMLQKLKHSRDRIAERLGEEFAGISVSTARKAPRNGWRNVVWTVRMLADYARYLHPRYREARALRARVVEKLYAERPDLGLALSIWIVLFVQVLGRFRGARYSDFLITVLLRIERALPMPVVDEEAIREFAPDVVLSSPYVALGRREPDFLRAAKRLGVRTGLLVASWDNLTNKGLIKITPDRVFLWNGIQRREAIELHRIPGENVVMTGAQRFDRWFDQEPRWKRDKFLAMIGFDPGQPFVLYLCSSPFIAPDEVSFVKRFLEVARASGSPLENVPVLIRPHPQNARQWVDADLSNFPNAIVWPPAGEQPIDEVSRSAFYDSMYHSAAVLGINTSALIEAGIVGKTVHTVLDDDFALTQEGTLHFHYLLAENGGLLHVAHSLDELVENLGQAVRGELDDEQTRRFVESFIRPHGLDAPATPILTDALEELARMPAPEPETLSAGDRVVRVAFTPLSWIARPLPRGLPRRLWSKLGAFRLRGRQAQVGAEEAVQSPEVTGRKQVRRAVKGAKAEGALLAVGPWLHDAATELLFWIPFVRWVSQNNDLPAERLIAISRGGNRSWYSTLCAKYVDILDLLDPALYRQLTGGIGFAETRGRPPSPALTELVRGHIKKQAGAKVTFLEPSILYQMFGRVWTGRAATRHGSQYLDFRRLRSPSGIQLEQKLPKSFVAAQFGFTPSFPDTARNRSIIDKVVERISARMRIVLLNAPLGEEIVPYPIEPRPGIVQVVEDLDPTRSFAVQSLAISKAAAFVGTYSSHCQIAAAHGIDSLGLYSDGRRLRTADVDWTEHLVRVTEAEFSLVHVSAVDLVARMWSTSVGGPGNAVADGRVRHR